MSDTILAFRHISKQFQAAKALDDVSFEVKQGEILGLLGANGAGKSTLLKILGGIQPADEGDILLEGQPYHARSAFEARNKGVISVYQELNLFQHMSVAENLFIGDELRGKTGLIDWKQSGQKAEELLRELGLAQVSVHALVEDLSVGQRQMVEIVRAISRAPKLLLLDEPTSSLSEDQIRWLFSQIRELVQNGATVIYVSHRLDEVVELCDRCAILRDGKYITTLDKQEIDRDTIVRHMVGHTVNLAGEKKERPAGEVVFSCQNLTQKGDFKDISFEVRAGEILGIGGLVGAGRSELLNAIFGITKPDSGTVLIDGVPVALKDPAAASRHGIALVSEDRKKEGLFLPESAKTNLAANTLSQRQRFGFISRKKETEAARRVSGDISFQADRLNEPVSTLSGGNQQKIVLGKSLLTNARVLLLDEPTRGVDVGAREEIYAIIHSCVQEGMAVVLVSSDWEELISLSDRVLVMAEGCFVGELKGGEITQENMLHLCTRAQVQEEEAQTSGVLHQRLRATVRRNQNSYVLALLLLILVAVGPFVTPFFMKAANWSNIYWQTFTYLLLTFGQLIVIISGGIDLSISAIMTVTSVIGMKLIVANPAHPELGILVMLAVGLLIGAVNGLVVVFGKVNAFVATLATQIILQGVALILTKRPISPSPKILRTIANGSFLHLPIVLYIGVALVVLLLLFLKRTRSGRYLFAVGENPVGASWAGLSAKRTRFLAFVLDAFFGVLAAYYLLGRNGAADPMVNTNLSLNSIAYALIGGGTLAGGKGNVIGSVLAAFVISVLLNILNHVGLNAFWQDIIRGAVILTILVLYGYSMIKERKKGSNV